MCPLFINKQRYATALIISFIKLQFMQRFNQNFLPSSFSDSQEKNSIRNIGANDIQLRNFDQLRLAHANLSTLDLFPLYNFPKIWQDFPDEQIKIIRQSSEFDAKLKNYFLSDLASNVICNSEKRKQSILVSFSSLRFFFIRFAVVVLVCFVWSCRFFSIIYLSVY